MDTLYQLALKWLSQGATPAEAMLTSILFLLIFLVKGIVSSQKDINRTLNNHFTESLKAQEAIAVQMAKSNEIQRTLMGKILDAALRTPEVRVTSAGSEVKVNPTS